MLDDVDLLEYDLHDWRSEIDVIQGFRQTTGSISAT